MQSRAFPLAVQLVHLGHEVTMFLTPYDNPKDSGREWTQTGVCIRNLHTGSIPLSYPKLLIDLWKAIDSYKPQLVHVFKPKGFAGAVGRYLIMKGKREIAVDCDDWEGWGGWNDVKTYPWIVKEFIDRQERWMMRRAPAVTVASRALSERVISIRRHDDGVYYVPNGVASRTASLNQLEGAPRSPGEIRAELNLPQCPLIFYSGHFDAGEDAMFFCQAAAPVAQKSRASLLMVGEGPELDKVRDYLSDFPQIQTRYFPYLPYEQYLQLISASDIAAFPYPDDPIHRSKCSARITDYMRMGKPVITSAIGQNKEYIVDGESGMLVPAGNLQAFSEALALLLRDPELRTRLGRNAERRIREEFNWAGAPLQQCLASYDHLIHEP